MTEENKIEVLAHPPKTRALYKCIVRASNLDDAVSVLREAFPDQVITKEDIIHWHVIKPSKQLELF